MSENESCIIDVYKENFEEEFDKIRYLIEDYPYVSMDTEFPGFIHQTQPSSFNNREAYYKTVKKNVDKLKIIQVGFTLSDKYGNFPKNNFCWQFNFNFDLNSDLYSPESIFLLTNSGINFNNLPGRGIEMEKFGEALMSSGLILNEKITWISFHGIYDFAYLIKIITNLSLPNQEVSFSEDLAVYFPNHYDIRYVVRNIEHYRTSLSKLAMELDVGRIGSQHQAGSDSIVTSQIFFKLKNYPDLDKILAKEKNILHGLGAKIEETDYNNQPFYPDYSNPTYMNNYNKMMNPQLMNFMEFYNPMNVQFYNNMRNPNMANTPFVNTYSGNFGMFPASQNNIEINKKNNEEAQPGNYYNHNRMV